MATSSGAVMPRRTWSPWLRITAMRRSHFPRPEQSFLQGQIELAYAVDFIDTRLYDDMRRRLDAAADSRWAELRSTNT